MSLMAAVLPLASASAESSETEPTLDRQRIVDLEWFLATEQDEEVKAMEPTPEELAAASARLEVSELLDGLEEEIGLHLGATKVRRDVARL